MICNFEINRITLLLMYSCFIFLFSCSEENEKSEIEVETEIVPTSECETVFSQGINVPSEGERTTISFTTNKDWSVSLAETQGGDNWCTVSPSSGKAGNVTLTILVTSNTGYDDRNIVLKISADELSKNIMINQKQKDALTLTSNRFEVDKGGGIINLQVKSNIDYKVTVAENSRTWIKSVISERTRGLSTNFYSFVISPSEEYEKREGEIIIQGEKLSERVKVYQTGEALLLLTQNEYFVSDEGATIAVEIKSNFDFGVKMPIVDWVKTATTRNVSSHTLYYVIAPNSTYDKREAEIEFYDKNSNIKEVLKIVQPQKDAIIAEQDRYFVNCRGSYFDLYVKTNVGLTVESSADWIQIISTRALNTNKIIFYVEENMEFDNRSGVITLQNGDLKQDVNIIQSGKDAEDNIWDGSISDSFYMNGKGTESSPYLITTCAQLAKLAQNVNGGISYVNKYFKLIANLDFNNIRMTPIGIENMPFSAIFDGGNKTIKGLNISGDSYMGLFGYLRQATIKNLTISNSKICGKSYVGAFVGYADFTILDNCSSDVAMTSGDYIGGVAGYAKDSKISNCDHQNQTIGDTHSSKVGGLVGEIKNTRIINSFNLGNLYGGGSVGGLVGYCGENSKIQNCYNKGAFPRFYYVDIIGGIVGYNWGGHIENCFSTGVMSGSTITGDMGMVNSGGIVGYNHNNTYLFCCYFLKQVPINKMFSYCGDLNWGTCSKCGSFDASGLFESASLSYSSSRYLRYSLNSWVQANQTSLNEYKEWNTGMGWPDFVD